MSGLILSIGKLARTSTRIAHFRSDGAPWKTLSTKHRVRQRFLHKLIDLCATNIVGLTPKNLEIAWSQNWQSDARCIVIPNGVRTAQIHDVDRPLSLNVDSSDTIILHVGRGDLPTKNRGKAIRIFAEYYDSNPKSQLFFIGRDGRTDLQAEQNLQEWRDIASQVGVTEQVHFLGESDSVSRYMMEADILLFTSSLEGLPGVVIEALSFGLPVISSDVPGAVFISQYNHNVQIVDVHAEENEWSKKLARLDSKLTDSRRDSNMRLLDGSPFDIKIASSSYADVWSAGLIHAKTD